MTPSIDAMRKGGGSDLAILDYLHLLECYELPVKVRVAELMQLWGCSQSRVSRRMAAVNDAGFCCVENLWGRYRVSADAPLVKRVRIDRLLTSRQRWQQLQQAHRLLH